MENVFIVDLAGAFYWVTPNNVSQMPQEAHILGYANKDSRLLKGINELEMVVRRAA